MNPKSFFRLVSNVANPFVIFTALYVVAAFGYSDGFGVALVYVAFELVAAALVAGYVFRIRRRRGIGGFWMPARRERLVPALVLLGAFVGLLVCLLLANAPPEVFRITASMGLAAAAVAAFTLVWKASAHAAVAGHAAVWGVVLLGILGLPFVVVLPLVAWSRVALGAHTLAQAVVGAGVGGVFALLFLL